MAMTSHFPQEFPFSTFTNPTFPSSSTMNAQNSFFGFGAAPNETVVDVNLQSPLGHPVKRNLSTTGPGLFDECEPKAKRKVERMNAHFRNFHISPVKNPNHEVWTSQQKQDNFQEVEDRLSDSSEEETMEEDDKCGSDFGDVAKKVHLTQMLKDYIRRTREQPVIIPDLSGKALVPYVSRNPMDDPSMRGRIHEISEEEAGRISGDESTEPIPYVEDFVEEVGNEESSTSPDSNSTSLSFVELPDDSEFDMDVDFDHP